MVFTHQAVFALDRFFDLNDHLGCFVDRLDRGQHFGSGGQVLHIVKATAHARLGLHLDVVTEFDKFLRATGGEGHAVFVVFYLFGYSDDHELGCLMD